MSGGGGKAADLKSETALRLWRFAAGRAMFGCLLGEDGEAGVVLFVVVGADPEVVALGG